MLELQPTAPRWERVALLEGEGGRTHDLELSRRALRWRVRPSCEAGSIRLVASSPHRARRAPVERDCASAARTATFVATGPVRLTVAAPGRWRAVVEQQVDFPLREPPLAAMRSRAARVLARGRFHPVQGPGQGTAQLYRLRGGRLALRLEGLRTSGYRGLRLWLSRTRHPKTTARVAAAPHVSLGGLKSTRGEQNYVLPRGLERNDVGSVVVWWSRPTPMAYTAAALE